MKHIPESFYKNEEKERLGIGWQLATTEDISGLVVEAIVIKHSDGRWKLTIFREPEPDSTYLLDVTEELNLGDPLYFGDRQGAIREAMKFIERRSNQ